STFSFVPSPFTTCISVFKHSLACRCFGNFTTISRFTKKASECSPSPRNAKEQTNTCLLRRICSTSYNEYIPIPLVCVLFSILQLIVPAPSNRQFSKCVIPKIVPLLLYAKKVQFVFETAKRPAASDGPCQFILYPSGC